MIHESGMNIPIQSGSVINHAKGDLPIENKYVYMQIYHISLSSRNIGDKNTNHSK